MKKELSKNQAELSNLIMRFVMDNQMSYEEAKTSFKLVKSVFLSDGLVLKKGQ